MARPRRLYHCTQDDHGDQLVVGRRVPLVRAAGEPETPRLCVCPSVPQCVSAVMLWKNQPVRIYRSDRPRKGVTPRGVWDQVITGERWLIPGHRLELVGEIPVETVLQIYELPREYHELGMSSDYRLRTSQIVIASELLPDWVTEAKLRYFHRMLEICGVDDPRAHFHNKIREAYGYDHRN